MMRIQLAIAIMLSVMSCDHKTRKLQLMPDMADGPTVKAQENYLEPPPHSVDINAEEYPATIEESEAKRTNPFPNTPAVLAKGEALFGTFCAACHGPDGKGQNALGPNFPVPPDITNEVYKKRADGFFFYRITFGGVMMPSYGHSISVNERWMIIHHLRTLQNRGH